MFLDFYKLREQPFGETPDPHFVYLSATHREALASLFYGIETGRGFLALIAEPGLGKTTLLFYLLEQLRSSSRTAFLFQTQCDSRELVRSLLADLGIETGRKDLAWMHDQLKRVLINEASVGRCLVVFIDEAQNLTEPALETVRLLSDFETPTSKLMQIVLAGQPLLADKLASLALVQLRQRISILSRLDRFTPAETDAYINHRLRIAGYKGGHLFTPEARAMIAAWSKGIPRNINNLCFNILSLGCALGRKEIDRSLVQEAANDLGVSPVFSEQYDSCQPHQLLAAVPPGARLHAQGTSGNRDTGSHQFDRRVGTSTPASGPASKSAPLPAPPLSSLLDLLGSQLEQASRAITLVDAVVVVLVVVVLFVVGGSRVSFLHRATAQSPAAIQTKPAPPVTTAANPVQPAQSVFIRTPVASRLDSQDPPARKPAWAGEIVNKKVFASLGATLHSAATIDRDAPPDLTGAASDARADAIQGILPASSNIPLALPITSEQAAPVLEGGRLKDPELISRTPPIYPAAARRLRLEGNVVIHGLVDTTGKLTDLKVVSGPPLLRLAALDSVRKWEYRPSYLDDKPVPAETLITVEFRLH